ncbi:hypothetical protein QJS04_geneDACA014357 [Acorus gramineus]|uniref:Knottins-like domain-containing protein n=1 Tax=Acorus gramineus TaxID=55184 RepID=A0AAV8ZYJ1_ACOGR|nr:hypothetical protein QJS04_geneDACA014357 [Acorus gramineus]
MRKGMTYLLLLCLLVLMSMEVMMMGVEGSLCYTRSAGHMGPCLISHNCAQICLHEGFSGGGCNPLLICLCYKPCS